MRELPIPPYKCTICGRNKEFYQMEKIREVEVEHPDIGKIFHKIGTCGNCYGNRNGFHELFAVGKTRIRDLPAHFWMRLLQEFDGRITGSALSRRMNVTGTHITNILHYLHSIGLLKKYRVGREHPYELTDEGRMVQKHLRDTFSILDSMKTQRKKEVLRGNITRTSTTENN